jgi:Ca2+/Na+ antiporter
MVETHAQTYVNLMNKDKHSIKSHFMFGVAVILFVFFLYLFFKNTLSLTLNTFSFFTCSVVFFLTIAIVYYFYKVINRKKINTLNPDNYAYFKQENGKTSRFFNILQILTALLGTINILIGVLNILDTAHNNTMLNNRDILVQPFYLIVISLTVISILFILSLLLQESVSHLNDISYNKKYGNTMHNASHISSLLNKGVSMSHITSDESISQENKNHATHGLALPEHDNGFFYKKLFEINDNVLNLKRHIIVPVNDNITETHIQTLWDNKIYPFLSSISERLKVLETKLDSSSSLKKTPETLPLDITNPQTHDVGTLHYSHIEETKVYDDFVKEITNKIVTQTQNTIINQTTSIEKHNDVIQNKASELEEVFNLIPENLVNTDNSVETEETFASNTSANILNNRQHTVQKNSDIKTTGSKEKTLKEMRDFLEHHMQQLHLNKFSKLT